MNEVTKKLYYEALNIGAQKVETVFDRAGGARRNPPCATLYETGRIVTNVEGAEEWRAFFEDQGVDPIQAWITTSHNKAQGLIFMYAANDATPGAIEVDWNAEARTYYTHFGAAMKECPAVRPITTVEVRWKPAVDKEGKPCLVFNVKAAKAKAAGDADPETLAARAEEEAAKKAAKEAARKRIAAAKEGRSTKTPPPAPEGTGQAE
jgi:hypothetical protein